MNNQFKYPTHSEIDRTIKLLADRVRSEPTDQDAKDSLVLAFKVKADTFTVERNALPSSSQYVKDRLANRYLVLQERIASMLNSPELEC